MSPQDTVQRYIEALIEEVALALGEDAAALNEAIAGGLQMKYDSNSKGFVTAAISISSDNVYSKYPALVEKIPRGFFLVLTPEGEIVHEVRGPLKMQDSSSKDRPQWDSVEFSEKKNGAFFAWTSFVYAEKIWTVFITKGQIYIGDFSASVPEEKRFLKDAVEAFFKIWPDLPGDYLKGVALTNVLQFEYMDGRHIVPLKEDEPPMVFVQVLPRSAGEPVASFEEILRNVPPKYKALRLVYPKGSVPTMEEIREKLPEISEGWVASYHLEGKLVRREKVKDSWYVLLRMLREFISRDNFDARELRAHFIKRCASGYPVVDPDFLEKIIAAFACFQEWMKTRCGKKAKDLLGIHKSCLGFAECWRQFSLETGVDFQNLPEPLKFEEPYADVDPLVFTREGSFVHGERNVTVTNIGVPIIGQPVVYVLRGVSGSGKSTIADNLASVIVVSADNFPGLYDESGNFNPKLLHQAHNWVLREALAALKEGRDVCIDNTSITLWELKKTLQLSHWIRLIEIKPRPGASICSLHGVPQATIMKKLKTQSQQKASFESILGATQPKSTPITVLALPCGEFLKHVTEVTQTEFHVTLGYKKDTRGDHPARMRFHAEEILSLVDEKGTVRCVRGFVRGGDLEIPGHVTLEHAGDYKPHHASLLGSKLEPTERTPASFDVEGLITLL